MSKDDELCLKRLCHLPGASLPFAVQSEDVQECNVRCLTGFINSRPLHLSVICAHASAYHLIRKALTWPGRLIAINAGADGSVVVG